MAFKPSSILVTGGAGFIGSNFIHSFMAGNPDCNVTNLDCLTYAGNLKNLISVEDNPRYRFVKGDIGDAPLVAALLAEERIDAVVHFAAESHVDRSITGPEIFVRTNVLGTQILLEESRRHWQSGLAGDFRFLQISTDEVYGTLGESGYFTEETPLAANSPYSASKAGADLLVRAYHETFGMPTLNTRCSNNYGPYHFPEKLIPLLIHNIINRKPLPVYGDGLNVRDWLHVCDHGAAVETVLKGAVPGSVYNIGGNNEWRNIDIVNLVCDLLDSRLGRSAGENRRLITFVKDRPGHDRRYAIDASRLQRDLGWSPAYTFEQGIAETIDWYLANQEWVAEVTSGAYREYYQDQIRRWRMILVVGANGMLGRDLMALLGSRAQGVDIGEIDISSMESVLKVVGALRPEVVINCAAYTDVDGCEANCETAMAVNGEGVAHLAFACREVGALLVQISTDYIFDGGKGTPYLEDDAPHPLSVYGESKLAGEMNAAFCPDYLIVRTQWLYGLHGRNFVETMLRLGAEKDEVTVVDDQIGSPTWTVDLARAVIALVDSGRRGIYHAANAEFCSWNGFARAIFEEAGLPVSVKPMSTEELNRPARRPLYSTLECGKLVAATGFQPQPWRSALREYLKLRANPETP